MSKEWCVTLPVVGSVKVFVEAKNAEEAIDKALTSADFRVVPESDDTEPGENWSPLRSLYRGNTLALVDVAEAKAEPA